MLYCPVCFEETLFLKPRGVIVTVINGKQMDTGRFLFNELKDSPNERLRELERKIEEFFKWYSTFQNKEPISSFGLYSPDFLCKNACKIPINTRISIIGIVFLPEDVQEIIERLAGQYGLKTKLKIDT